MPSLHIWPRMNSVHDDNVPSVVRLRYTPPLESAALPTLADKFSRQNHVMRCLAPLGASCNDLSPRIISTVSRGRVCSGSACLRLGFWAILKLFIQPTYPQHIRNLSILLSPRRKHIHNARSILLCCPLL